MSIVFTGFAIGRHFNPEFAGTKIGSHTPEEFLSGLRESSYVRAPGYAPFCRHLFVRNFTDARMGVHRITEENRHLLQSDYVARREGELPILTRWFDSADVEAAESPWLDIILYSAEQLQKEGSPIDGDWGIVSILSAASPDEAPMPPITAMRNALGKDEGGSGVALDREYYMRAVEYWSRWATIK